MYSTSEKIAEMVELLPEQDQSLAFELVRKLVIAWDPDFTNLTPREIEIINSSKVDFINGDVVNHEDINWD